MQTLNTCFYRIFGEQGILNQNIEKKNHFQRKTGLIF